jgi:adenylate cyclase
MNTPSGSTCQIRVYENQQLLHAGAVDGPCELGRQEDRWEKLFSQKRNAAGLWRLVIARLEDHTVSRRHVRLEPLPDGRVRVTNVSSRGVVRLLDGSDLPALASCEASLPVLLTLGSKTVRVEELEDVPLHGLAEATVPPGRGASMNVSLASLASPSVQGMAIEPLVRWLQGALDVLQSAAGASDFFDRAARAVIDLVGLDTAWVLTWQEGECRTQAVACAGRAGLDPSWQPSREVLDQVRQKKRTLWQVPQQAPGGSLRGVTAVVAAPILDREGEVIGAVYGDRRQDSGAGHAAPVGRLEALLVELLAGGVAAGLARVEQEQAALRARVLFEQFFTRELSLQLTAQPDLLQGRDTEVTVLFCDVRGFSRVSERLGPAKTVEWIGDLMGAMSECVHAQQGVVVDYIGDELMAMWGAPQQQPDHARRACQAALDMLGQLPQLNARWQPILQEPLALGIGVNTGPARVGNVGTPRKFKYGPLGNTVNLGSRVQGATKYLKTKLLITQATQARLGPGWSTRRLCRVRVVNIAEPVALFELAVPGQAGWADLKEHYEKALAEFEGRSLRPATRILGNLLAEFPDDGPTVVLLSRAVSALVEDGRGFDPVWELPGK